VLVAINEKTQGVAYDPPRGRALCQLRLEGDSVAFITGDLTENGEEYQLAFRGTLTDSGLAGMLLVRGMRSDPRTFPATFTRVMLDANDVASDTGRDGLYAAVSAQEGEMMGNELLVLTTRQGVIALYTVYSGVPFGPSLAKSVRVRGDSMDIVTTIWGPTVPFSRTFVLIRRGADQPFTHIVPEDLTTPRDLGRIASVAQLFRPERSTPCVPAEVNGQPGR
jgi:hypothetical protein